MCAFTFVNKNLYSRSQEFSIKTDEIAGPLPVNRARQGLGFDNRTDPAVKAHKAIYVRTKSSHGQEPSRTSQEHRGKDHAYYNSAPQMHQK